MKFWDASALVPLCLAEPSSQVVRALLKKDGSVAAWWGTPVECASAFARLRRDGVLDLPGEERANRTIGLLESEWTEIEPSRQVRSKAQRLLRIHPLRAADSLQLAAALVWAGDEVEKSSFVCLDRRLRDAARSEGFSLLPAAF